MQIANLTKKARFEAELADTVLKQAIGLSFSKPKNMLFKFNSAKRWSFWMFGMQFDIWMAFLDDGGRVFQVIKAEKMTFNPATWKIYKPAKPCKYVLESQEKLAEVGDTIVL